MTGLIRGKPLVWVRDGTCWRAESQFGVYYAHQSTMPDKYHWDLSPFDDLNTIHEGESYTLDLAQAACQADHDQRAMASVEVVPFQWVCINEYQWHADLGFVDAYAHLYSDRKTWRWQIDADGISMAVGTAPDRDAAITAAEQFVRQLVMGVKS